jgi:cytochrome P450
MNENVWENPGMFNPERFLDAEGNVVNSHKIIPFGIGK